MKHLFILNPVAGGNKKGYYGTGRMLERFAKTLNETYEIYVTKHPSDAISKVLKETESGAELRVYACGGDGTLNECVCGAAHRENAAVTHFPCGTGNDFIRMFGPKDAERFRDLNALAEGEIRPLDLIECNDRYGINICSVGIDARIASDVHKYSGLPVIGGAMGYVTSTVLNVIKGVSQNFDVKADGYSKKAGMSLICACNGKFYGGGFNPVPEAEPDDELLDFLIIDAVSRIKLVNVVSKYAGGRYKELSNLITHIRGKQIEISAEKHFVVNIDGESMFVKNVNFAIVPKGVNFLFPAGMEYFQLRDKQMKAK